MLREGVVPGVPGGSKTPLPRRFHTCFWGHYLGLLVIWYFGAVQNRFHKISGPRFGV